MNDALLDDCFEPEWVPSHQESQSHQTAWNLEPWNVVGIPHDRENQKVQENRVVRKVVRDIESGLYSANYHQDQRKEQIGEKIDISQAKLYWKEKESKFFNQESKTYAPVDYRTDFPREDERDDTLMVLKIERADSIALQSDDALVLTSQKPWKRDMRDSNKRKLTEDNFCTNNTESTLLNYEKNWSEKDSAKFDIPDSCKHFKNNGNEEKDSVSEIFNFENSEAIQITTRIPRIRVPKTCKSYKKFQEVEKCSKCGTYKPRSFFNRATPGKNNRRYSSIESDRRREKNVLSRKALENYQCFSLDPRKSRANFFGNSGSYTLRCNLNPIGSQRKKKFYLTPASLPSSTKSKEAEIFYESFAAKKREFVKCKKKFLEDSGNHEAVMW